MPDFASMPVFVDPVRGALLTLLPLAFIAGLFFSRLGILGWRNIELPSDVLFHSSVYQTFLVLLYFTGHYDATGFFLFPADQIVRLIHDDRFTGGIVLIAVSLLWGWLSAVLYPRLSRRLSQWVNPETTVGRIAFHCAVINFLFWFRYLLIYPLLLAPRLYLPLNIHRVSFHLDVLMINLSTIFFLVGLISSLAARRKVGRLAALSVMYIACPGVLIPLTTWVARLNP